ncbi:MAG: type II toxin-antitoxin system VapC family toxin [Promethearchaeota archaeon]
MILPFDLVVIGKNPIWWPEMIILDTTACIDYLNGLNEIKKIISEQEDLVHITSITVYEINIGLERTKRKISEKRYQELFKIWTEFISSMEIFPLGYKEAIKAAEIYESLEANGQLIDDNDILTIGIMVSNGISKIITKNVKHFEKIEQIEIINY